ncbi:MAG TPA: hypothetical protein VKH81_11375 [Candidatus Angelobacter sp.]|nr:hypothetical protein [Candidatus Angelobacter sp.]
MMKRCSIALFLLLACAYLPAQTGDCAALTRQALDLSGFNQSVGNFTALLSSDEFMQQFRGRESTEEFIAILKPIVMKQFEPKALLQDIQNRVSSHCNVEQMTQTVAKLQTPFVARMLALEAASNTPEGQAKLKRYINIASTAPPTDDRMEALDALDASSGTSDFVTDMAMAVTRGMMTGAGAPPDVVSQLQAHRKDLKAQMQNNVELSMSVTYHGVTRPELLQYAKEVGAPPLKGFYALVNREFVQIMEERSQGVGQDLKKAMETQGQKTN